MCALAESVAADATECERTLTFAKEEEVEVVSRGGAHDTDVTADRGACAAAVLTTDEDTAVGAASDCVNACTAATRAAELRAGWADARSARSQSSSSAGGSFTVRSGGVSSSSSITGLVLDAAAGGANS